MERNTAFNLISQHVSKATGLDLRDLEDSATLADELDMLEEVEEGSDEAEVMAADAARNILADQF